MATDGKVVEVLQDVKCTLRLHKGFMAEGVYGRILVPEERALWIGEIPFNSVVYGCLLTPAEKLIKRRINVQILMT